MSAENALRLQVEYLTMAVDDEREKAARLERERDALAAKLDEREGDMHARIRAEYDRTIADTWRAANARMADERDALAAQLAALREAAGPAAQAEYASDDETRALRIALADTAPAAEAYTRRVQANECERVAVIARKASMVLERERGEEAAYGAAYVSSEILSRAAELRDGR